DLPPFQLADVGRIWDPHFGIPERARGGRIFSGAGHVARAARTSVGRAFLDGVGGADRDGDGLRGLSLTFGRCCWSADGAAGGVFFAGVGEEEGLEAGLLSVFDSDFEVSAGFGSFLPLAEELDCPFRA